MGSLWLPALVLSLLAGGCARPITLQEEIDGGELAEENLVQLASIASRQLRERERLWRVGSKLSRASVDLCQDRVARRPGIHMVDRSSIPDRYGFLAGRLGIGDVPRIRSILPGAPASLVDLKEGDEVLAIDDLSFEGEDATRLADVTDDLADSYADGLVRLTVRRAGRSHTVVVATGSQCGYPIRIATTKDFPPEYLFTPGAYATGDSVLVTRPMFHLADVDEELAFVVSHELAHNIMRHMDARRLNVLGGLLLDFVLYSALDLMWDGRGLFTEIAKYLYSHEFEAEADYVGLYLMARSGMDIDGASLFWRKYTLAWENLGLGSLTHPSRPERHVAMGNTIEEIKEKIAKGEPLLPNIRPEQDAEQVSLGADP